jgi:hypothetical protein
MDENILSSYFSKGLPLLCQNFWDWYMKIRGLGLSLIALSEKYTFILIVGTRVKSIFTPFKSNAGHVTPLNC